MRVLLLFQSGFLLFLFSSLIALAKTSKTMLNSSGESGHTFLAPDFKGNAFNFSPSRIMFAVVCPVWLLLFWDTFLLCLLSGECYQKWVLNFVKGFLCIYWDNHIVFIFQFVNVVYHIDWFVNIEESLHPWDKATWSWCMIFLMRCWILIARILLRIFASMFISDIGL